MGPQGRDIDSHLEAKMEAVPELTAGTLQLVRKGLWEVVASPAGTGHKSVYWPRVPIAGKTGTAESGGGRPDHAWFAGMPQRTGRGWPLWWYWSMRGREGPPRDRWPAGWWRLSMNCNCWVRRQARRSRLPRRRIERRSAGCSGIERDNSFRPMDERS